MNPFEQHAALVGQYETLLGGGNAMGLATLSLGLNPVLVVPVTHTKFDGDFVIEPGGRSSRTVMERCEFRVSLIPQAQQQYIKKGLDVVLTIAPGVTHEMTLWDGGMMEGGQLYRFMLVGRNYKA